MLNKYKQLKEKQQEQMNQFPKFFAFTQAAFEKGMGQLGLELTEENQIVQIAPIGFNIRKSDVEAYFAMSNNFEKELKDAIALDSTSKGFIFDMYNMELADHEYSVSGDVTETLDALGLTEDEVNQDKRLRRGLELAKKNQRFCLDVKPYARFEFT